MGGPRGLVIGAVPGLKICDPECNVTQILPEYRELGVQTPKSKVVLSVNPSGTALLTLTPIGSRFKMYESHWQETNVKHKQETIL